MQDGDGVADAVENQEMVVSLVDIDDELGDEAEEYGDHVTTGRYGCKATPRLKTKRRGRGSKKGKRNNEYIERPRNRRSRKLEKYMMGQPSIYTVPIPLV